MKTHLHTLKKKRVAASRLFFYVLLTCLAVIPLNVIHAADIGANSNVQITTSLIVFEDNALHFNLIYPVAGGDTITMLTNGNRSSVNGSTFGGTGQEGDFTINGTPNAYVTLTFTDGILSGTGQNMTVTNFTTNRPAAFKIGGQGSRTFKVGADLIVNANQATGVYNGTYNITVEYQ